MVFLKFMRVSWFLSVLEILTDFHDFYNFLFFYDFLEIFLWQSWFLWFIVTFRNCVWFSQFFFCRFMNFMIFAMFWKSYMIFTIRYFLQFLESSCDFRDVRDCFHFRDYRVIFSWSLRDFWSDRLLGWINADNFSICLDSSQRECVIVTNITKCKI